MKKNQLASLALLGLASALVSTPVVATENVQETYLAAHGCKNGCAAPRGYRGQVAENSLPSNGLQNAAAKPQTLSVEEQEILNRQNQNRPQYQGQQNQGQAQQQYQGQNPQYQGQGHSCAGQGAPGASHGCASQQRAYQGNNGSSHGCAGASGASHACGSH